jgi:TRAP-type C4-dicarboxylate transport system substrate-binding protein
VVARLLLIGILLVPSLASAQTVLRLATVVPDGTAWARELKAMAREIQAQTHDQVKLKFYWGGIAGDELDVLSRIRRSQLDGVVSGGVLCQRLAPSLQVTRVPGLLLERDEVEYVTKRLRSLLDKEFIDSGFVNVGFSLVGPAILFTRNPVRTMADLESGRFWVWDVDQASVGQLQALGFHPVPLPIAQTARAYDEHRHDGFVTPPNAALGFQWSAQTKYFTPLPLHFVIGCMLVSTRAFDALSQPQRDAMRQAVAKATVRLDDMGRSMDDQLLKGLLEKQGLQAVPVSAELRREFLERTRSLREGATSPLVSRDLLSRVLGMLADFRGSR